MRRIRNMPESRHDVLHIFFEPGWWMLIFRQKLLDRACSGGNLVGELEAAINELRDGLEVSSSLDVNVDYACDAVFGVDEARGERV